MVSEPVSKKIWYQKKSRNRSRKKLVPKKVSESVSKKFGTEKSLGIGIVQILGLVTHCNKQWQIWQILSSKHISHIKHMRDTQWQMKSHWVVPLSAFLLLSHLRLGNHGYHTSHTRPSISWLLLLWTHLTFELFFSTSMPSVRMIMSHPAPSPHLLLWPPVCLPYITHPLKSQVVCSQSQQRQNSEICRKEERWYLPTLCPSTYSNVMVVKNFSIF